MKIKYSKNLIKYLSGILVAVSLIFLAGCSSLNKPIREKTNLDNNYPVSGVKGKIDDATKPRLETYYQNSVNIISDSDLVFVNYSISLENGEILITNKQETAYKNKKSKYYQETAYFEPLAVLAGSPDLIPGIQKIVEGMKVGETRKSIIKPEEAFGSIDEKKIKVYSSIRSLSDKMSIPVETYIARYKKKPLKGNLIKIVPYFLYEITEVTENEVLLGAVLEKDELLSNDSFGKTVVRRENGYINIRLKPQMGASFQAGKEGGVIISIGKDSFTVDYNHPLAGKSLVLDVTAVSLLKKSALKDMKITWYDKQDEALKTAEKKKKPIAMVFYEDGCPWCKKLFSTTLEDPRIEYLENDFIWIKTNGYNFPELMDMYEIDSYPTILLLDSKGKAVNKMVGFKTAPVLRDKLNPFLEKIKKASLNVLAVKDTVKQN